MKPDPDMAAAGPSPRGRVILIDDDADVLDAFRQLIELEGYVCEAYGSASAYLDATGWGGSQPAQPVCLLCDVKMPEMDGLQLQAKLRQQGELPVILMSGASSASDAASGFRSGAIDFLVKPIEADQLLAALEVAMAVSRQQTAKSRRQAELKALLGSLSEREFEVAWLVARGLTGVGIALALGISPRTVKFHRQRVFEKLGISGTPELVRLLEAYEG